MSANEYRNETRLERMLRFIDRIVSLTEGMTRASIETDGDKHDIEERYSCGSWMLIRRFVGSGVRLPVG